MTERAELTCRRVDDRGFWNRTVADLPGAHVLQSWEWGEIKASQGWRPVRLLFTRADVPVAAASVLMRRLPLPGATVMYVPKGPCLAYSDSELWAAVLGHLARLAQQRGALFVKIDPDLPRTLVEPQAVLAKVGFVPAAEQVQFRNTVVIDVRPDLDDLLARMKPKTRYNIGLAARRGVTVRGGGSADWDAFLRLYEATSRRDGFLIRPSSYYHEVWETLHAAGLAELLLAEFQGVLVSGLLLLRFGSRCWYFYGASSDEHRREMPSYLIQARAIERAKEWGCTHYDLWGAPNDLDAPQDPADGMWGVYRFKQGFGGELVQWAGAYDHVARPRLHRVWTRLLPRYLAALRRLRGGPAAT